MKKDFYFFSNLPKSRVGGFEKLFIKKLWPYYYVCHYLFRVSDGIFDPLKNFHVHSEESLYSGNK